VTYSLDNIREGGHIRPMTSPLVDVIRSERAAAMRRAMEATEDVFNRLDELNEIGAALSLEKDLDTLLEKILTAAKTITRSDGGTLYLLERDGMEQRLRFAIVRTTTLGLNLGGTTGRPVTFDPIPLYLNGMPNSSAIAAHVALTGLPVIIDDAYLVEGFDFANTRDFDRRTGYRSQSVLTVPMVNHDAEIMGVLQLINSIDPVTRGVTKFSKSDQRLAESLASQAAVAYENRQLIVQLENLFESFIELINSAIDEKSPYTGGHCSRVPILTMMLADAVDRTSDGPLARFRMTERDRYELRIAGLLHDCGKITTPVHIVDKATKLESIYDRIHLIDQRFEVLARDAQIEALQAKLSLASNRDLTREEIASWGERVNSRLRARLEQMASDRSFLRRANQGVELMPAQDARRVRDIAEAYTWRNEHGDLVPFLTAEEVAALTIRSGTLTAEERKIVNHHIVSTIKMLESLPWPKYLKNVPEYAGGHHERMDGKGYPRGLRGDQMSVQARIMAIADIFEALTAKDRPYKRGKKLSEAMHILGRFAVNGHIDPDLYRVFVREKIYVKYALQYVDPAQVDEVDESTLPLLDATRAASA
jgi:HD-GYP domain-containing protein (c-di-GMP phosphodiesterase class II)